MIEHNEDGAFGLVINNCLPTRVADVTESLGLEWYGEEDEKVRLGGPVEPVRGFVLHDQPGWDPLADEVCDEVAVIDRGRLIASGSPADLRIHAGAVGRTLEEVFLRLTAEEASPADTNV